jgi:hypothetical protein
MNIDKLTINLAIVNDLSNKDKPGMSLQNRAKDTLLGNEQVNRNDVNHATSSIVSISDKGLIASRSDQESRDNQQPLLKNPVEAAASNESTPQRNLQNLINDLLSGRITLGITEADMQAARDSAANSDLQLKLMDHAAMRAGFNMPRHIKQENTTVDETTFQARGVIRTKV